MSRLAILMNGGLVGDPGLFDIVKRLGGQAIRSFVPGGSIGLSAISAFRGGGALGPAMRPGGGGLIPTPTGPVSVATAARTVFPGASALLRLATGGGAAPGVTRGAALGLATRGAIGRVIPAGAFRAAGFRGVTGVPGRRRRRMNPTNFRALTRGIRRIKAFSKLARQVLKAEARVKAPRKGARGFRRKQ